MSFLVVSEYHNSPRSSRYNKNDDSLKELEMNWKEWNWRSFFRSFARRQPTRAGNYVQGGLNCPGKAIDLNSNIRVKQIYLEASYEIKLLALFFFKRIYAAVFCLWPAESETEGNRGWRKEKMDFSCLFLAKLLCHQLFVLETKAK